MSDAELEDLERRISTGYSVIDPEVLLALVAEVRRARHPTLRDRVLDRLEAAVTRDDDRAATRWAAVAQVV